MAMQAFGFLCFVTLCLTVQGQYKLPLPIQQQQFPQYPPWPYQPYQAYPQMYPQYQPYQQSYPNPNQGYPGAYYPSYSGYQPMLQQQAQIIKTPPVLSGLKSVPAGYQVVPLSPEDLDENDITFGVSQPSQEQQYPQPTHQQPLYQQPRPVYHQAQPTYTVEIATSAPSEYVVHEDHRNTTYTNTNTNTTHFTLHKTNSNAFNKTLRKVFTNDGTKSGSQVYTINIVNGVEVTTTEDPNSIGNNFNSQDNQKSIDNTPSKPNTDDLEENNNEPDDTQEVEKKPTGIFSWLNK